MLNNSVTFVHIEYYMLLFEKNLNPCKYAAVDAFSIFWLFACKTHSKAAIKKYSVTFHSTICHYFNAVNLYYVKL